MASEVAICNLALQRLGAKSISSLTEDSTAARACNRVFEQARDSELRAHPWSFARARVQLAAVSTDPIFGFAKQYALPADYLRILPTNGVNATPLQDDFQIESNPDGGRVILTNTGAPINLIYIKRVVDPQQFDALFTELLIARIAMDTAEEITQSNTKKAEAKEHYREVRSEARRINAFERPPEDPPQDRWLTARL